MLERVLALDLELTRQGRLVALAAIFDDQTLVREDLSERTAREALDALATFGRRAAFVLGHNLIHHDIPALARLAPRHPLLALPRIDTLLLSPLAFPERPYHRLIKDDRLVRDGRPAPLSDCRACLRVLADITGAIRSGQEKNPSLWRYFQAAVASEAGHAALFGQPEAPAARSAQEALDALKPRLRGLACDTSLAALSPGPDEALPLAYVLAWLQLAPGSCLPAWARLSYPETTRLLHSLRERSCGACDYCRRQHSPEGWLSRVFGYEAFRTTPAAPDGTSLQRAIVAAGLENRPLYAVLPTGTGKSLCFQIPAIARYERSAALTVVISPLQSLMKDQVDQLRLRHPFTDTINGSLTTLERARALDNLREGGTSLLYISPEQLRNQAVRKALARRQIGAWVIDEAHCLSEWGHDFRTDYLYIPRFVRELAAAQGVAPPPVQCFTGTSQVAVTAEIRALFQEELQQELEVFDGGTERDNLTFSVESLAPSDKMSRVIELLTEHLGPSKPGAAIVFCATQKRTEQMAMQLQAHNYPARAYHAGMEPLARRETQEQFLRGEFPIIAATSAFGMGVDKPDVRLVIHEEIPGSLEAYLQQAGRAGRDRAPAHCALLFAPGDIDTQFSLAARSQLNQRDLQALWRAIRLVPGRKEPRAEGEVELRVLTRGELARMEPTAGVFDPHDPSTDTRISAGLGWLERAGLFERDENHNRVFQGKPKLPTLSRACAKIDAMNLSPGRAEAWKRVMERLYEASDDEGLSADDLAELASLVGGEGPGPVEAGSRLLDLLHQMVEGGLLTAESNFTAFLRWGVEDPSTARLKALTELQRELLAVLAELEPDPGTDWLNASPRLLADRLSEEDRRVFPDRIVLLLHALRRDGQGWSAQPSSLDIRGSTERLQIRLRRDWPEIHTLAKLRSSAAERVLGELVQRIGSGERSASAFVAFSLEDLTKVLAEDLILRGELRSVTDAVEQALLWMHDAKVITLQSGLAVFRQAMALRRRPNAPTLLTRDKIAALTRHQEQRTVQLHVVNEYAQQGAKRMDSALELSREWFSAQREEFLRRWFHGRRESLQQPTSPESMQKILQALDPTQREVVTAGSRKNLLILAGPGSGKTRVLVHRVAYLVRVKRVRPQGILVVCYTRANAIELRRRLRELIGDDARGLTVSTLHGLAMRLCGTPPQSMPSFDDVLNDALAILRREKLPVGADADSVRDLALRGASHLLVDEYQDLDERQAALIEAIGGRREKDTEQKLHVLAVGDDDQSIFNFRGGSSSWIARFAEDWGAEQHTLTACYRCEAAILAAAEAVIEPLAGRLKAGQRLVATSPPGGPASVRRIVAPVQELGRVVLERIREILDEDPSLTPDQIAVLCRTRDGLAPVRHALEEARVPFRWPLSSDEAMPLSRMREIVAFREAIAQRSGEISPLQQLRDQVQRCAPSPGPWREFLDRFVEDVAGSFGNEGAEGARLERLLWESIATERRERTLGTGLRLGTLHGAKGLEWRHVILIDEGYTHDHEDDLRRLYYVGMTRAQRSLTLVLNDEAPQPLLAAIPASLVQDRRIYAPPVAADRPRVRYGLLHLDALWVSWAGRGDGASDAVLAGLPFGASVRLREENGWLHLIAKDRPIAAIKRDAQGAWRERAGLKLRLVGVVVREGADEEPQWREKLQRERWLVPICEARWQHSADPFLKRPG